MRNPAALAARFHDKKEILHWISQRMPRGARTGNFTRHKTVLTRDEQQASLGWMGQYKETDAQGKSAADGMLQMLQKRTSPSAGEILSPGLEFAIPDCYNICRVYFSRIDKAADKKKAEADLFAVHSGATLQKKTVKAVWQGG